MKSKRYVACICLVGPLVWAAALSSAAQQPKPKNIRLPAVSLKSRIIWEGKCELPDGTGLAFGGQDQKSDDGIGRTRLKVNGEWQDFYRDLQTQRAPLGTVIHGSLAVLANDIEKMIAKMNAAKASVR